MNDGGVDEFGLIVGLGNPGVKYRGTRHNIGFDCLDELHRRMGSPMLLGKYDGQYVKGKLDGHQVILLWPLTFMNASGKSVVQVVNFFKLSVSRVLVICDDMSLPLGKLRLRKRGSSGGQKGLADILRVLGTDDIARLRIGIEPPPEQWDAADYVLSRFNEEEKPSILAAVNRGADGAKDWLVHGIDYSMNQYNADLK